jgi:PhzF family phenazine biosynthesis protein
MTDILRYAAFSTDPAGGNPAGVVLGADLSDPVRMQALATDIGYSETAFAARVGPDYLDPHAPDTVLHARHYAIRYFSPLAEVPFCGHATIATAVAIADRGGAGPIVFHTPAGLVPVDTSRHDTVTTATLISVTPWVRPAPDDLVRPVLAALRWAETDLDPALPARLAYAGARHLILAAATRDRLARLNYAFDELADLMRAAELTTVHLAWREDHTTFHVRDPFPVGGVVEDPATGAAAAAFGAYLRELGLARAPARITLHQGHDLGRPGQILVDLVGDDDRIRVTGQATPII